VLDAVRARGAAAIGYPATDSIKEEREGKVLRGLDRDHVWQVQTPQGAAVRLLRKAYETTPPDVLKTDEVALLETIGVEIHLVRGSRENIKVTVPGDEEVAELLLNRRRRKSP
jgi:2-C-methyl-D-erythritol 4-phosphate cytidylyltransferase